MNNLVQVEVLAGLGSRNFLIFRRKLNRMKEEVRRKKEGKMAETTEIGDTGEGTTLSATVGDPARTTTLLLPCYLTRQRVQNNRKNNGN